MTFCTQKYIEKNNYSNDLIKIQYSQNLENEFFKYSQSFFYTAELGLQHLCNENMHDISKLDTFFFPLTFLYRHSIELLMKAIVFKFITKEEKRIEFLKKSCHNLKEIFNYIKRENLLSHDIDLSNWLENYFDSINLVDKNSDSFRYPFQINKNTFEIIPIFAKQLHIDLIKFSKKFRFIYKTMKKIFSQEKDFSLEYNNLKPLFLEVGGDYYSQSVVGNEYNKMDYSLYISAYSKLNTFLKTNINLNNKNKLFFPICYLYRNGIELSLKGIYLEIFHTDNLKTLLNNKHKILKLWKEIFPTLENIAKENDFNLFFLKKTNNYCNQLNNFDPDSSLFRYPVRKNLSPYFSSKKTIVLKYSHIINSLEKLCHSLEGIYDMIITYSEFCQEQYE